MTEEARSQDRSKAITELIAQGDLHERVSHAISGVVADLVEQGVAPHVIAFQLRESAKRVENNF